jgi:hypothetical protein
LRLDIGAFDLQVAVPSGLTIKHHQEYKKFPHLDYCAQEHAEKKCRKLRMGAIDFSGSLKIAQGAINLWDLLERKRNGVQASTKKRHRLMHPTVKMTACQVPLPSVRVKRKAAMSAYKKVKKQASSERINSKMLSDR